MIYALFQSFGNHQTMRDVRCPIENGDFLLKMDENGGCSK